MSRSQVTAFTKTHERESKRQKDMRIYMNPKNKTTNSIHLLRYNFCYQPGEEDAFDHHKVLHENIPFCLLAQAANCVSDAQLDGTF